MDNRLIIRDYDDDTDRSFVMKSWLGGLHSVPPFIGCRDSLYYVPTQRLLDRVISAPCAKLAVVVTAKDPNFIAAWACFWVLPRSTILWWIHTRDTWREMGVAKHLLDSIPGKRVAFVFRRIHRGIDLAKKLEIQRKWEYYPTLVFEAFSPEFGSTEHDH